YVLVGRIAPRLVGLEDVVVVGIAAHQLQAAVVGEGIVPNNPRPLNSTLFPYTTLFRSRLVGVIGLAVAEGVRVLGIVRRGDEGLVNGQRRVLVDHGRGGYPVISLLISVDVGGVDQVAASIQLGLRHRLGGRIDPRLLVL